MENLETAYEKRKSVKKLVDIYIHNCRTGATRFDMTIALIKYDAPELYHRMVGLDEVEARWPHEEQWWLDQFQDMNNRLNGDQCLLESDLSSPKCEIINEECRGYDGSL